MEEKKHYAKAPLTEAIIDLKVTLPSDTTVDTLSSIYASIRDFFPNQETIHLGAVVLQPDTSAPINTMQQIHGFLFRSDDKRKVFQAKLDGFTFNLLAPYTSWEDFRNDTRAAWNIYKSICKPEQVTRVTVRFINRFEFPGNIVELKDFLRISPDITSDLPKTQMSGFFMQLQIPQDDCLLIINETLAPPTNIQAVSVILDFELSREQIWQSDDEEIWLYLEKLRKLKNSVFEASITDKTREMIR